VASRCLPRPNICLFHSLQLQYNNTTAARLITTTATTTTTTAAAAAATAATTTTTKTVIIKSSIGSKISNRTATGTPVKRPFYFNASRVSMTIQLSTLRNLGMCRAFTVRLPTWTLTNRATPDKSVYVNITVSYSYS